MATPDMQDHGIDAAAHPSTDVDRIDRRGKDAECAADLGPEALAAIVDATPGYRVLREIASRTEFTTAGCRSVLRGIVVDVETTGLDPRRDEVIAIGMVPFKYTPDGDVISAAESFSAFRQPTCPIPAAVTRLTGITDATVDGLKISADAVDQFIDGEPLMIAHNASFDRPFIEAICPRAARLPWACSLTQVDWLAEGFVGARLHDLAHHHGTFFRSHRAVDDCRALLEILSKPLPETGVTALAALLQAARRPTFRISARGAPFDTRNLLKASGYRWNPGEDGRARAWWKEVAVDKLQEELRFLSEFFFDGLVDPLVEEVDAYTRFSART